MSPWLQKAIVAIEDRRFYEHEGIDYRGTARALVANTGEGDVVQGGSTITQQLARALYLGNEQSYSRKLTEGCLAVELDREWSKERILAGYLNRVPFGNRAYGAEAAARTYFSKPADEADPRRGGAPRRAAAVAVAARPVREPRRREGAPRRRPRRDGRDRRDHVGAGAGGGAEQARARPVARLRPPARPLPRELRRRAADRGVRRGRPPRRRARRAHDHRRPDAAPGAPGRAADAEPPRRSRRRASSRSTRRTAPCGRSRRSCRVGAPRSTSPSTASDSPARRSRPSCSPRPCAAGSTRGRRSTCRAPFDGPESQGKPWHVETYDRTYLGRTAVAGRHPGVRQHRLRAAHARPRPRPRRRAWRARWGSAPTCRRCPRSGSAREPSRRSTWPPRTRPSPPAGAAPSRSSSARSSSPTARSTGSGGRPRSKRSCPHAAAYEVTRVLERNIEAGTGTGAAIGRPAAGKTGTTENHGDAWFAGYTPQLATVVWVGYPGRTAPMTSVHGIRVTGGTFPATIWQRFMAPALEPLPAADWEVPAATIALEALVRPLPVRARRRPTRRRRNGCPKKKPKPRRSFAPAGRRSTEDQPIGTMRPRRPCPRRRRPRRRRRLRPRHRRRSGRPVRSSASSARSRWRSRSSATARSRCAARSTRPGASTARRSRRGDEIEVVDLQDGVLLVALPVDVPFEDESAP